MNEHIPPINEIPEFSLLGLPENIFSDTECYIRFVKNGVTGTGLKKMTLVFENEKFFASLLQVSLPDLNKLYKQELLDKGQSEQLLDTSNLFLNVIVIFGDWSKGDEWLNTALVALGGDSPIELCDTFAGRSLVLQILRKIEYGEFS